MSGRRLQLLALLLLGLMAFSYYQDKGTYWLILASSAGLFSLLAFLKNWFGPIISILAFSLPLSIAVPLSGSTELVLPAEFLLIIIAPLILEKLMSKEGLLTLRNHPLPALWLATFIPGILFSEMLTVSIKYFLINGIYVLVFYYGVLLWRREGGDVPKLIRFFSLGMLPAIVWGFIQFVGYEFNPVTISGIFEPFFYSHTYLGATAAILAGYFLGTTLSDRRWIFAGGFFALLTIASTSRAALWSLAFMLLIWGFIQLPVVLRFAIPALLVVAGISLGGVDKLTTIFYQNTYESHDPQASLAEKSMSVTNVKSDVSNIERLNRWISALRMFKERPHTGFGPGTYQFTYIPYQEPQLENRLTVTNPESPPEGSGGTAHSEWLLQLSENGWPSLLIFCWILGKAFFKVFGTSMSKEERRRFYPFFLGLCTYLFHMQFNNFLNQPAFAFLFWMFLLMMESRDETVVE